MKTSEGGSSDPYPARTQQLLSIAEESLGIEARMAGLSIAGDDYLNELCQEAIVHEQRLGTSAVMDSLSQGQGYSSLLPRQQVGAFHPGLYFHGSGDKEPLGLALDHSQGSLGLQSSNSQLSIQEAGPDAPAVGKQPHEWYGKISSGGPGPSHLPTVVSGPYYGRPSLMATAAHQGSILHGLGGSAPRQAPVPQVLGPALVTGLSLNSEGHDLMRAPISVNYDESPLMDSSSVTLSSRSSRTAHCGATMMICPMRMILSRSRMPPLSTGGG